MATTATVPGCVSDINPGNKFSVILAFDVPVGTQAAALEFHDSMFSGGVRVAVH